MSFNPSNNPTIIEEVYTVSTKEFFNGIKFITPPSTFRIVNIPNEKPGVFYIAEHKIARLLRRKDVLCIDSGEFSDPFWRRHPQRGWEMVSTAFIQFKE